MEKIFRIILMYIPIIGVFAVHIFNTDIYMDKKGENIYLLNNDFIFYTSAITQGICIPIIILKLILWLT